MDTAKASLFALVLALSSDALAQDDAPPPSLTGIVVDHDSTPIEGAFVAARSSTASLREPPQTTRTDANGRFRLTGDATEWGVAVRMRGFVTWSEWRVQAGAALRVVLQRGTHAITGVVRDGLTLEPVIGARVALLEGSRSFVVARGTERVDPVETSSDDEGWFTLDGLGPAKVYITASSRGYRGVMRRDVEPGEPLELFLFPASSISGRVLDDDDEPIEGAVVLALSELGRRRAGTASETTGDDGSFELRGLEPGRYWLVARHPDRAPRVVSDIEVENERDVEIDIYLSLGTRVSGRLVDVKERPVDGRVRVALVDGAPVDGLFGELTASADDGVFTLPALPAGRHELTVRASGFKHLDVVAEVAARDRELDLGDIVVETGLAIRGTVVSGDAIGIAGASVYGYPIQGRGRAGRVGVWFRDSQVEARTETDGTFVLAGLEPGHYRLDVRAPGFGSARRERVEAGAGDLELMLERAGVVQGSVVDPDDQPIGRASVSVRTTARRSRGGGRGFAVSEPDGSFVIEDIAQGTYIVHVAAPDFLTEVVSDVKVAPGEVTDMGTLRVRRGALVRGTVTDPTGEPVAGANVRAQSPGEQTMAALDNIAVSGGDGRFVIRGLRDGPLQLVATHPSFAEARVDSLAAESGADFVEADVVLSRGGSVEGHVRSSDGAGLGGRVVRVFEELSGEGLRFDGPDETQTRGDGYFRLDHLPIGLARVELFAPSGALDAAVQRRRVEINESETAYVEFETRRVLVQGHVTRGGVPLAGAELALRSEETTQRFVMGVRASRRSAPTPGQPQINFAETRADGSFELIVEQPGSYVANVGIAGTLTQLSGKRIEIPDIAVHAVTLDFGGATIRGVVVDKETDDPIAAASVVAQPSETASGLSSASATTSADGAFDLEVDPGRYAIEAHAAGFATEDQPVDVSANSTSAALRIALEPARYIEGRVIDARGQAMARMWVLATATRADARSPASSGGGMTLADGTFRVERVGRRPYNLFVGSELAGFGHRANVRPGASDVEIALTPGGRVAVFARDENGEPLARVQVSLAAIDGARFRGSAARTRADGTATLSLPVGAVELRAVLDELEGRAVVRVTRGAELPVEILLRPATK